MTVSGHSRRFYNLRCWSAYTPIADEFRARADFQALMSVVRRKAGVLMRLVHVPDGPKAEIALGPTYDHHKEGRFQSNRFNMASNDPE